jgi:hypothetical protein
MKTTAKGRRCVVPLRSHPSLGLWITYFQFLLSADPREVDTDGDGRDDNIERGDGWPVRIFDGQLSQCWERGVTRGWSRTSEDTVWKRWLCCINRVSRDGFPILNSERGSVP